MTAPAGYTGPTDVALMTSQDALALKAAWIVENAEDLHLFVSVAPDSEDVAQFQTCRECGDNSAALAHANDLRVMTDWEIIFDLLAEPDEDQPQAA